MSTRNIKPATILFIDHAAALGGAERSLLLLLAHLDRARWLPRLAAGGDPLLAQAAALGVPAHPVSLPRLRRSPRFVADWRRGADRLARLAQQTGARTLHANTVRAALYTAVAARRARLPFIWHVRDFWLSEAAPNRRWPDALGKRLLVAAAAVVIANSRATAAHLPPSPKVRVIPNGIDVTHFDPALPGAPFRRQWGIPPAAPLVGMAGRLRPWKGQRQFLAMAQQAHNALPQARFVIAGGDPFQIQDDYAQELVELTRQYGLSDVVVFTGQLDDVRPALAALDVFVHPGAPEPFGLVNVEAMAMAKPVVAFAHGALPEIVAHEETGILVPPGDAPALATAVTHLLQAPQQARALGQNGRSRAVTHFDGRRTAAEIAAIYGELGLDR